MQMNHTYLGLLFVIITVLTTVIGPEAFATSSWIADNYNWHPHTTAHFPAHPVCGDHLCKPGEKYHPRK